MPISTRRTNRGGVSTTQPAQPATKAQQALSIRRLPAAALCCRSLQQIHQLNPGGSRACRVKLRARPYHKVQSWQPRVFMAEHIARKPLIVIAGHGLFHDTFADDHTKARAFRAIGPCVNLEPLSARPALVGKNRGIGMRPVKPTGAGKRKRCAAVTQTAKRARPLARRARMTARPARVFIRTRKPWVRLRRVVDGW